MSEIGKSLYESHERQINSWLNEIELRRLVLPRFQRMEAWEPRQVQELLQSVVNGHPIGSVLLLQVGDKPMFKYRALPGAPEEGESVREMLLDGQQRLAAIWKSFNDNYEWVSFFLQIEPDDYTEEEELPIVRKVTFYNKKGKKYPLWPNDPKEIYNRGLIPFYLLHPENQTKASDWAEEVSEGDLKLYKSISDKIDKYRDIKNYQIPYIALKPETPADAVITAFTKLNTQGTPLSAFDLVVARMEAHDVDMHYESERLREEVPALEYFQQVDDLDFLRSLVLLNNQVPTQSNILKMDPQHLASCWDNLIEGTKRAIEFLQQEGVIEARCVPVEPVLPVLFAMWTYVPYGGIEEREAVRLLRKYMWRAFFSDRYERGGMTTVVQDFRGLRDMLHGENVEVPCFSNSYAKLPDSPDEFLNIGTPKKKIRLARAMLCATLRGEARDFHDGRPITPENIKHREYHHLFPVAFLKEKGYGEDDADLCLNQALVTWKTNRRISAKDPKDYLKEATQAEGGEEELRNLLKSHLIPSEPFFKSDYMEFLSKRAEMIFEGMQELTEGNDWRPRA